MPRFYLEILIVMIVMFPLSVGASSRLYDADAVVTVRNGKPCFSYPASKEKLFGYSIIVSRLGQHETIAWQVLAFRDVEKNVPEPTTPDACIEYGVTDSAMVEKIVAESLVPDAPYRVYISVYEAPVGGNRYRYVRKVGSEFCVTKNEAGETVIVGLTMNGTGAWHCLMPDESPKRGFWQRLFGK